MNSNAAPNRTGPSYLTCGTCGRHFFLDESDAPPFCSARCKMIDLGRWLDEEIGVPHEGSPDRDEAANDEINPSYD